MNRVSDRALIGAALIFLGFSVFASGGLMFAKTGNWWFMLSIPLAAIFGCGGGVILGGRDRKNSISKGNVCS